MKNAIILGGAAVIAYLIYKQYQGQQDLKQSYNETATLQSYINNYFPQGAK